MSKYRIVLAAAAFVALAMLAAPAGAQIHGGIGGVSLTSGSLGGIGSGFNPFPGGLPNPQGSMGQFPMSAMSEEGNQKTLGYPDLKMSGQIGVDPNKVPQGAQVVMLRLDGALYPMVVKTSSVDGGDIEQRGYISTKELYRSALQKQLTVVGNPDLRRQIAGSSGSHQPMEVDGYVFNRISPYFVVRSVTVAQK